MSEEASEPSRRISNREFIALAALLISLVAMSIDAMLPALGQMGRDLEVTQANDTQLVVSALFLGLAIAQVFFGPLSDSWGRKPAIYLGLVLFCLGCIISLLSANFEVMLVGRVLQGMGAAGPKIVTVALIRDQYKGAAMARIMSTVMAVFIIVPALAPSVGQGILLVSHWRAIFVFLLAQGLVAALWFGVRQQETLVQAHRMTLSPRRIARAAHETWRSRTALGYTLAAGFVFGAFLGYLNSAQQVFQEQYGVGRWFPAYFGGLAVVLGMASIFNARMVLRIGMYPLSLRSLSCLVGLSMLFAVPTLLMAGQPPLWAFMAFLVCAFFCIGILFGNFNAMAMEPLGHIAGTAAAVIASLSTFLSLGFGIAIGRAFDGTVQPLVLGFTGLSSVSLLIVLWVPRVTAAARPNSRAVR